MICVIFRGVNMKKSLFVYNEGTLQRHDNTIRFIDTAGNKKIYL